MKRFLSFIFINFFIICGVASQIFVATTGDDRNSGKINQPKATLHEALRQVRELRRLKSDSLKTPVRIILKDGVYQLSQPVFIRPEDSGTAESPTFIEAAPGEKPILSGGISIKGWKKSTTTIPGLSNMAEGKIWVTDVPLVGGQLFNFRQLWVNDVKAVRAKSANGNKMHRILNWNKKEETAVIPALPFTGLEKETGVEMFIHQWWAIANLRVKKMQVAKDSTVLHFHHPESSIQSEHPWPAPWLSKETGNSAFYLTNALQFLDEPGEWYLDIANGKLYYWPRANENMATATVVAPYLETLLQIKGTADNPVKNLIINGLSFQHTGWLRPSKQGHVPHQTGMYMLDAYKLRPSGTPEKPSLDNQAWVGRPAAAVDVNFAEKTELINCGFEHLASTGLDYHKGVKNNIIKGNLFKDIGGNAILAGIFSDEAQEVHLPYNPKNEDEICDNIIISNNYITDATNEDWGCVGIGAGYVRNAIISNNEIENVAYSGISMGWGWTPQASIMRNNKVVANKIKFYGKHNYDCAGIYTLSAQPGSVISENYIDSIYKAPYAHLPTHWFYLYTDEGSSGITVKNNWTPTQKYLQNNNGPGNVWENNGPAINISIKHNAGLEEAYQYLAKNRTASLLHLTVNEDRKEVMELISQPGQSIDMVKLKKILQDNGMDADAVYKLQNRYIIYSKVKDVGVMQGRLQNNFPGNKLKVYHNLVYEYNAKNDCYNKTVAKEWDDIVLTANLIADENLPQDFSDYNAAQFEKWSQLSKDFCTANFEQLHVFENDRQLVLTIRIPKEEASKIKENKKRIAEWNEILRKFRADFEVKKKGEIWVYFEKV